MADTSTLGIDSFDNFVETYLTPPVHYYQPTYVTHPTPKPEAEGGVGGYRRGMWIPAADDTEVQVFRHLKPADMYTLSAEKLEELLQQEGSRDALGVSEVDWDAFKHYKGRWNRKYTTSVYLQTIDDLRVAVRKNYVWCARYILDRFIEDFLAKRFRVQVWFRAYRHSILEDMLDVAFSSDALEVSRLLFAFRRVYDRHWKLPCILFERAHLNNAMRMMAMFREHGSPSLDTILNVHKLRMARKTYLESK